jgi:thiol-disulfide isomerase/thioredoxin
MKKFALQVLAGVFILTAISLFQIRNHIPHASNAPAITGVGKDGTPIHLDLVQSGEKSSKTSLLYFFAPWCGVCKMSMGNLNILSKMTSANIIIVALDYENPTEVIDLIKVKELESFELILGDTTTNQAYKIEAYPSYYVISADGKIVTSAVGYTTTVGMLLRIWLSAAFSI